MVPAESPHPLGVGLSSLHDICVPVVSPSKTLLLGSWGSEGARSQGDAAREEGWPLEGTLLRDLRTEFKEGLCEDTLFT